MLPEVPQHLHSGDGVCGLVLPGVPAALHPDSEQVHVPAHASERHRRGGHPSLLHHPHRGLPVRRREDRWLREQLPGEGGLGSQGAASPAHLLRDEAGPPLPGPAGARPDSEEVHPRVRPTAPVPVRGHGSFFAACVPGRKRDGRQTGVYQYTWQLLVGRDLHDHGGLWGHGAQEYPRPGGGAQQHPERHPPHGVSRHLHLSHLLSLLPGAEGGAGPNAETEAGLAGQHQVPEQRGLSGDRQLRGHRWGRRLVGASQEVAGRSESCRDQSVHA